MQLLAAPGLPTSLYLDELLTAVISLAKHQLQYNVLALHDPQYKRLYRPDLTAHGALWCACDTAVGPWVVLQQLVCAYMPNTCCCCCCCCCWRAWSQRQTMQRRAANGADLRRLAGAISGCWHLHSHGKAQAAVMHSSTPCCRDKWSLSRVGLPQAGACTDGRALQAGAAAVAAGPGEARVRLDLRAAACICDTRVRV
jgi:hypothetical protein